MNIYKTNAELRALARTHMFGNYKPAIGAYVLMNLILMVISLSTPSVTSGSLISQLIGGVSYIFVLLLSGLFSSGSAYLYLNIICGRPVSASMIFYGFRNHASKALAVQAYILIMQLIVSVPFILAYIYFIIDGANIAMIGCILTLLVAIVGVIYISLSVLPAFYLLHDFPDYTPRQILEKSRSLMSGNIKRALLLSVSFIPMDLLSFLSLGIGALWVEPYKNATYAEFFLDLIKNKKD